MPSFLFDQRKYYIIDAPVYRQYRWGALKDNMAQIVILVVSAKDQFHI